MCGIYFSNMTFKMKFIFLYRKLAFVVVITSCLLSSCGKAYFPIELKTVERSKRLQGQEEKKVELVSMTKKAIKVANSVPYKRMVIDSRDLNSPAKLIPASEALKENFPLSNDPGPYIIGLGDVLVFSEFLIAENSFGPNFVSRPLIVSDEGFINLYGVGSIKAAGLTQSLLEDEIYRKLIESDRAGNFEMSIFNGIYL